MYSCVCVSSVVLSCVYIAYVCLVLDCCRSARVFGGVNSLVCVMSGPALHWLLQTHFATSRYDGESVVHVVADQVTHAFKPMVFCTNLNDKKNNIIIKK